jgi:hypothetical protein
MMASSYDKAWDAGARAERRRIVRTLRVADLDDWADHFQAGKHWRPELKKRARALGRKDR